MDDDDCRGLGAWAAFDDPPALCGSLPPSAGHGGCTLLATSLPPCNGHAAATTSSNPNPTTSAADGPLMDMAVWAHEWPALAAPEPSSVHRGATPAAGCEGIDEDDWEEVQRVGTE
jgi:hypothetical protein